MSGLAVILYARSGIMRSAFNAVGWDAIEVDVQPGQGSGLHWQGDVFDFMQTRLWRVADIAILHPVCTYLSGSGLHWNARVPGREACTLWSLEIVRRLIDRIERDDKPAVMENPVGVIGTKIRPATQTVQPYQFGDDASKRTCLWMFGGAPPPHNSAEVSMASRAQRAAQWQVGAALGQPDRQRTKSPWTIRGESRRSRRDISRNRKCHRAANDRGRRCATALAGGRLT